MKMKTSETSNLARNGQQIREPSNQLGDKRMKTKAITKIKGARRHMRRRRDSI